MLNAAKVLEYKASEGGGETTAPTSDGDADRMSDALQALKRSQARVLSRNALVVLAASADLVAILWAAIGAGLAYNYVIYGWLALNASSIRLSFFVALVFLFINIARRNYLLSRYMELSGHARQTIAYWNIAFMLSAFLGFLERSDASPSRGAFISFYFTGLVALYVMRALMVHFVRHRAAAGRMQASRIMIVGYGLDLERLLRRDILKGAGKQIVERCELSGDASALDRELAKASRSARRKALDEILIVAPLARADVIERCVRAFVQVPAVTNVLFEPGSGLARFAGAHAGAMGKAASLRLPGHSVSSGDLVIKRGFDIVFAAVALVLALPLMLAVALAIKGESPGPVFFTQIRHGYNKRPFRIFKFRTMTAIESGRRMQQAKKNDFRVTGMGRFMRRFNIDELPQLVNVLRGEMSLVGPRPHAISHDRQFSRSIEIYERRHNIKPGITGWAQVNGLRGPTDTDEKIEMRVRFDLHYIDNWTLWLDIRILFMTLFSRAAYRNAF